MLNLKNEDLYSSLANETPDVETTKVILEEINPKIGQESNEFYILTDVLLFVDASCEYLTDSHENLSKILHVLYQHQITLAHVHVLHIKQNNE